MYDFTRKDPANERNRSARAALFVRNNEWQKVSQGHSSKEVPASGMERRAQRTIRCNNPECFVHDQIRGKDKPGSLKMSKGGQCTETETDRQ